MGVHLFFVSSLSVNNFRNIIATSDQDTVYNYPLNASLASADPMAAIISMAGTDCYATVITPSLLIGGVDLRKASGSFQKLPVVPAPAK